MKYPIAARTGDPFTVQRLLGYADLLLLEVVLLLLLREYFK